MNGMIIGLYNYLVELKRAEMKAWAPRAWASIHHWIWQCLIEVETPVKFQSDRTNLNGYLTIWDDTSSRKDGVPFGE